MIEQFRFSLVRFCICLCLMTLIVGQASSQDLSSLDELKDTLQEIQRYDLPSTRNRSSGQIDRPLGDAAQNRSFESRGREFGSAESGQESTTRRSLGGSSTQQPPPGLGFSQQGFDSDYETQLDDIRNRLQLIRKLRRESRLDKMPPTNPFNEAQEIVQDSSVPSGLDQLNSGSDFPIGVPREDIESPVLTAIETNLAGDSEGDNNSIGDSPEQAADAILTAPVDEIQLAQSLFQTKNYQAALNALTKIERSQLPDEDYIWLDLLSALCRRRMGNEDDSELLFRELSNLKSEDLSVKVARDWLKQSETCANTRSSFEELSQNVDLLMERLQSNEQ